MSKKLQMLLIMSVFFATVSAQEFRCGVSVNYQKLQSTTQQYETGDVKIFETMKQAIEEFVNNRRWTNLDMEQVEKLDCSISLILSERISATDFRGQISVQLRRPVFNSNYTSGVLNYMENNDLLFTYNESQPLEFDPNTFYDNLSSTLAYYCYIMLGMYFDSYGPNGGEPFFDVARTIVQTARSSPINYKGWQSKDSQKARYWFMENHTNSAYEAIHSVYYYYYRLGLDMMTKDQPTARQNIIQSLRYLLQVHKKRANLLSVTQFLDVNISEIVSIFTPAPPEEQKEIFNIVKEISPINVTKLKDWNVK